jgi:hypothetical protein
MVAAWSLAQCVAAHLVNGQGPRGDVLRVEAIRPFNARFVPHATATGLTLPASEKARNLHTGL